MRNSRNSLPRLPGGRCEKTCASWCEEPYVGKSGEEDKCGLSSSLPQRGCASVLVLLNGVGLRGQFCPPGDQGHFPMSGDCFLVPSGGRDATGIQWWRPGLLLETLPSIARPPLQRFIQPEMTAVPTLTNLAELPIEFFSQPAEVLLLACALEFGNVL